MRRGWLIAAICVLTVAGTTATAQWMPPGAGMPRGMIAELQWLLKQHGYDPGPVNGVMTDKTRHAIVALERAAGLPPDGIPGPAVMSLLFSIPPRGMAQAPGVADPVVRAQRSLERLGFLSGRIDGILGPATRDAIIRFQIARGLPVDPRVSDRLLAELRQASAPAAAPAPPPAPTSAPPPAAPEALGRQQLPPGVKPPPIH